MTKIPNQLQALGPIKSAVIHSSDALDEKTKATEIKKIPIEGTLLFYVALTKSIVLEQSTKMVLSVKDIYGANTAVTQLMGNWLHR